MSPQAPSRGRTPLVRPHGADAGFTFVEVLIALTIVAISMAYLMTAQSAALRAEQRAQDLERQRLLAGQALTAHYLEREAEPLLPPSFADDSARWTVTTEPTGVGSWIRLAVAPSDTPHAESAWYIRRPAGAQSD